MGVEISAGLHVGECEVTSDRVRGAAVEAARRIQLQAGPDEILVSSTVRDLVAGSGIRFQFKGAITHAAETFSLLLVERSLRHVVA
jgi:class 3 adenylate cyclase